MTAKQRSEAAQAWLEEYGNGERRLDLLFERLAVLDQKMTSTASPRLDGMPHGGEVKGDRFAEMVAQKEEITEKIRRLKNEQAEKRKRYEAIIDKLSKPDEAAVLELRYIERLPWNDVTDALFGGEMDLEDRHNSFLRRTMKYHGSALQHLADILEEEGLINADA